MGNTREYNRKYYEEHKAEISAKRRRRYLEDPEFAELSRKRAREGMRRKRARERLESSPEERRKRNRNAPRPAKIEIRKGVYVETEMYTVGALAAKLHRSVKTIYYWESKDIIPKAMFRNASGHRVYTKDQVDALVEALFRVEREVALNKKDNGLVRERLTLLRGAFHQVWKKLPNGVKEPKNA